MSKPPNFWTASGNLESTFGTTELLLDVAHCSQAHMSLLLQVENPGKYMYYPKKLLSDMAELVARLAESSVFVAEVSC